MNYKPILLIAGEPNSIFLEIFFKLYKFKKYKSPLILIGSFNLLKLQMKKLKFKKKIRILNVENLSNYKLNNKTINLIDINYKTYTAFEKPSKKSNKYIENCFKIAIKLINSNYSNKLINGPIIKENFLNKKFLGITEYISRNFKTKKTAMLIFNKELSVCPITTHLPINMIAKKIKKKLIIEKVNIIDKFYKNKIGFKPKIAVTGLNPHCESINKLNEDVRIIKPAIKDLKKKGFNISGPYSADTIFLKKNRSKFNVILGMYHDQVLTPFKTLFEYDAINITAGLPFVRVSPDHGPNVSMLGKNRSNPLSLLKALIFLDKLK